MNWMKSEKWMLLLTLGAVAIVGAGASEAQSQNPRSIVLSKTQALVKTPCAIRCSAAITDDRIPGTAEAVMVAGPSGPERSPDWTLVTFPASRFEFKSKQIYMVAITPLDSEGNRAVDPKEHHPVPDKTFLIDTTPAAKFAAKAAGPESVNLTSNVAFSEPGKSAPLMVGDGGCPGAVPVRHIDVTLQYPGIEVTFKKTGLCEIDMSKLPYVANPDGVGVVQGVALKESDKSKGALKPPPEIVGLASVLGDSYQVPSSPELSKPKAPATEAAAWLWISGTVTAGTRAAPAWVLDGKLAPVITQLKGPTIVTWGSATVDVGNNKINGQSAKDVIDFCGPSVKLYKESKTVGVEPSLAPTYETNLALNHRNLLAVGDVEWDFAPLNENQFVRTARAHRNDLTKMPKQGDFSNGYAEIGWDLHFHTGLEAGGALAAATVTNSKTKKTVGTIPTYSIGRFVPGIDGIYQYRWLGFESNLTGRYLFATEHTAVNDKAGNPYLETVSGWKAVNVATFSVTPGDMPLALTITYTNGFSAPTYQRANGVKIGLLVKY
jgi:hypothetical protein